ncbi:MAG: hypothetical protein JWP12_1053 [Bacteroidetes bacterium]|nr:hypothetical protein [Bacteroidota bacterium]
MPITTDNKVLEDDTIEVMEIGNVNFPTGNNHRLLPGADAYPLLHYRRYASKSAFAAVQYRKKQ